jgi:peptidoglycan hydrolase-like protein with peptidoglycan-binding domain
MVMRALGIVVAGALVLAGLVGCDSSGDGRSDLEVAQAKVDAKKKALEDAEAEFADRSEAFCGSSETYIQALDRYGDLLTQTAPTVGDVTEAGADLEDPRDEAESGAEAAVDAHQAVLDAEQELADAKAALAEIKNPGSAASSSPSESSSPEPLVPAATVSRVQQAETELSAVERGISADTPLAEASQQFNAAVVALEVSWLQLLSDAGCLTDDREKAAVAAVHDYTRALQQSLHDAGYYEGEVDGVYGPKTVDAVESLQKAHDLPVTGTVDKATADALEDDLAAEGGAAAQEAVVTTTAVQQTLKITGFWDGPVDGTWTPELTDALKELQTQLGVKPTGSVDAATIAAVEKAIAEAQSEPSEDTSSASPTPSSSASTPGTPTETVASPSST